MQEIILDIPWDDRRAVLKISNPGGAGNQIWHVYLDNYYNGQVILINGEIVCFLHETSELYYDDQQIIKELINEHFGPLQGG
jgi:hypothetical protein